MNQAELCSLLEASPIIAAVKEEADLPLCLSTDCAVVFILCGTVTTIGEIVARVKEKGRVAFVHLDLVRGLSADEASVEFLAGQTEVDGIISTKHSLLKRAKQLGLMTIQRFFLLDSMALENVKKQSASPDLDFIEILPALMPKVIAKLAGQVRMPLIAGGLIEEKEDITAALAAGAVAVSSTKAGVWGM